MCSRLRRDKMKFLAQELTNPPVLRAVAEDDPLRPAGVAESNPHAVDSDVDGSDSLAGPGGVQVEAAADRHQPHGLGKHVHPDGLVIEPADYDRRGPDHQERHATKRDEAT